MDFNLLLASVQPQEVVGDTAFKVSGLAYDSRQVLPGWVFFALPGAKVDGFEFVSQAWEKGAVAVVAEKVPAELPTGVCVVRVANVRLAMAKMGAAYYGDPTAQVPVIGVTGTNGKTTITYLLEEIMTQAGYKPAVFGTVTYRCGETSIVSSHTTPESLELIRMMKDFRDQGADAFVLEVSSHALEQHRVDGVHFDIGVFTNLTPEHLDYHHDLDGYFASKKRLFTELLINGKAVINKDDSYGSRLLAADSRWKSFGRNAGADLHPTTIRVARDGIHGHFSGPCGEVAVNSALIGDFNVSNLLAAVAAMQELGVANDTIARGIENMAQVPGRVEAVVNDKEVLALVDYAHTGDALEQVLKTLSSLDHRRLLTVVGCGGDRDPGKRPVMARVAVDYSDLAIFTSDNPRTEDPLKILEQIKGGAVAAGSNELGVEEAQAGASGFIVIPGRREAIDFACGLAEPGDLLLVAGKGHEDYQILGVEKIHFDDREELYRALNSKGEKPSTGVENHV